MNNLNNKPITSKQANTFRNSWKECLSNEISNLFYIAEKTGPVERYNSYFGLGKAGIAAILATGEEESIRLYMGSHKVIDPNTNEGQNTFLPLLKIGQAFYVLTYELKDGSNKKNSNQGMLNSGNVGDGSSTEITEGTANLFRNKWDEMPDRDVLDAFSGLTYKNIRAYKGNGEKNISEIEEGLKQHRVESYEINKADVNLIKTCLKTVEADHQYFHLYLGAGLTVQIWHPFDFRPIFEIPANTNKHMLYHGLNNNGDCKVYFERTKPCPPYCDPTE